MKKTFKLPFEKNPLIQMYQHTAFYMGIIQAKAKNDISPWLCGKFINCMYDRTDPRNQFYIHFVDRWLTREQILFQQRMHLTRKMYEQLHIDLLKLFQQMLLQENYVYGFYNEQMIPQKASFQSAYFNHNFLLIGFNSEKKIFYSVGYLNDGHFQEFEIPFDVLEKAILSLKDERLDFSFFKFNQDAKFELSYSSIVIELDNYLQSTVPSENLIPGNSYGIAALYALIDSFVDATGICRPIDLRYTRGLMERESLMQSRVEFLAKQCTGDFETMKRKALEAYEISKKAHFYGIKYNLTRNATIVQKIQDHILQIISIEKEYLPDLIETLKKQIPVD